jgi:hemolysin II/leukocidin/hemolysin toxin family protein
LDGFIPSGRTFKFPPHNSWAGAMLWPFQYSASIVSETMDQPVKISASTPNNTIRNKEVSDSITYGVRGGIKIEGKTPRSNTDVNAAFTKIFSYNQPDYETTKVKETVTEASWHMTFTETTGWIQSNQLKPIIWESNVHVWAICK